MDYAEAVTWWLVNKIGLSYTGGRYNQNSVLSLGGCSSAFPLLDVADGLTITECVGRNVGNIIPEVSGPGGSLYHAFLLHNGSKTDFTLKNVQIWVSKSSSAPDDEVYICTDSAGVISGLPSGGFFVTMSSVPSVTSSPTVSQWYGYGETVSVAEELHKWDAIGIWVRHSASSGSEPQGVCSFSIDMRADVS